MAAATIFLVAKRLLKLCGEREMWRMIWYSVNRVIELHDWSVSGGLLGKLKSHKHEM